HLSLRSMSIQDSAVPADEVRVSAGAEYRYRERQPLALVATYIEGDLPAETIFGDVAGVGDARGRLRVLQWLVQFLATDGRGGERQHKQADNQRSGPHAKNIACESVEL